MELTAEEFKYGTRKFIPEVNPVHLLNSEEPCLTEYGVYALACQPFNGCPSLVCANSLEVFKCCLKTSRVGVAAE